MPPRNVDQDDGRKELLERIINHHFTVNGNHITLATSSGTSYFQTRPQRVDWLLDGMMDLDTDGTQDELEPNRRANLDTLLRESSAGALESRKHNRRPSSHAGGPGGPFFNDLYGAVRAKIEWERNNFAEFVVSVVENELEKGDLDGVVDRIKKKIATGPVRAEHQHTGY